MIASVLPLPHDPTQETTASQHDLEQQFAQQFGPANDKAFQKATWWRNLNRVMSGIGTLLVIAIVSSIEILCLGTSINTSQIVLAVFVSRMP